MGKIRLSAQGNRFQMHTKTPPFAGEFILEFDEEYQSLVFTKPTLDYTGRTKKLSLTKAGWYVTTLTSTPLPVGTYVLDEEESNEDIKIYSLL